MAVRAKFQVQRITNTLYGGQEVTLMPQYDESIPEDARYAKATPSGEIKLFITNPLALEQLYLGGYFYVDFTEVTEKATAVGA